MRARPRHAKGNGLHALIPGLRQSQSLYMVGLQTFELAWQPISMKPLSTKISTGEQVCCACRHGTKGISTEASAKPCFAMVLRKPISSSNGKEPVLPIWGLIC